MMYVHLARGASSGCPTQLRGHHWSRPLRMGPLSALLVAVLCACHEDPVHGAVAQVTGSYLRCGTKLSRETFTIKEDGSASLVYVGDAGGSTIKGHVLFSRSFMSLVGQLEYPRDKFSRIAVPYMAIEWGERLYLVAYDELLEFCNAANSGSEPRTTECGRFFIRDGDWNVQAPGRPALPVPWSTYVLLDAIVAHVVEYASASSAWIDVGRGQGIQPGMRLLAINVAQGGRGAAQEAQSADGRDIWLNVVDVEESRALVESVYGHHDTKILLPLGTEVRSRP